ncbi:restriction endonuclease subunit S [Helicobacter suis]|uniref:restriction endonuclease subunit S n=1 Tax=Helicobacter suis TaxID=104628 RepID=UPI0013CF793F|nr:restriction endonuclease subunit S [Helicobacter suis]
MPEKQESLHTNLADLPLQEALKELRARGVEFVELGEVCSLLNGYSFKKTDYVKKSNTLLIRMGNIRPDSVFNPEYKAVYLPDHFAEKYKKFVLKENDILIAMTGSNLGMTTILKDTKNKSLLLNQRVVKLSNFNPSIHASYLYYFLITQRTNSYIKSLVNTAAQPNLGTRQILSTLIPLPPLFIQERIVTILDCLTELTAELTARKKQFHYYLNALLDFNSSYEFKETKRFVAVKTNLKNQDSLQVAPLKEALNAPTSLIKHPLLKESFRVEWVRLGDIGEFVRGNGLTKADLHPANTNGTLIGAIHYGEIHTYYKTHTTTTKSFVTAQLAKKLKKVKRGDLVIVGVSEDVENVCKAVAYLGDKDICIGGDTFIYSHKQNPKFIAYLLQTHCFLRFKKQYAHGAKVTRVNLQSLKNFNFPLPPLPIQKKIVNILDQLQTLTSDLSQGIPAEIKARKKQFNYYLNHLLDFKGQA